MNIFTTAATVTTTAATNNNIKNKIFFRLHSGEGKHWQPTMKHRLIADM
jgi:hypothetical protein